MSELSLKEFDQDLKPLLKTYCYDCHGAEKQKGKFRIDTLSNDLYNPKNAETWHDVLDLINTGEMPPEDEEQPSLSELETLTDWLNDELKQVANYKKGAHGIPSSRLTKYEYQNTIRDLLGINMDFSIDLPPEGISEEGFKNNAGSMQMSPLQMELYLNAARKALDKAIVTGDQPRPTHHEATKSDETHQRRKVTKTNELLPGHTFGICMKEHPTKGPFQIKVKVRPEYVEKHGAPRLRVAMGYRPDVKITEKLVTPDFDLKEANTYTFTGHLEEFPMPSKKGKFPGLLISVQNVYDDGTLNFDVKKKKKKNKKKGKEPEPEETKPPIIAPKIIVEHVSFTSPYYASWPPQHHLDILPESELRSSNERAYIEKVLKNFVSKAYRRPAAPKDLNWLITHYSHLREHYDLESSLKEVLSIVLISPNFLYRIQDQKSDNKSIDNFSLASRLSYFLWSSMPDPTLFNLAKQGKLKQNKQLKIQVQRMLKDPKSWNFIEQFSSQWLDLDGIDRVAINPQYYPKFDIRLKEDMREESKQFFAYIFKNNLSALNFLDSDFMMVNNRLSRHYQEDSQTLNGDYEMVKLSSKSQRGGLLAQGSMLLSSSTGMDSAPIKRAVWVREKLLHDPPAPPPPDVPSIDATDPNFQKLSAKEQLRSHREVQACILCHKGLDPWGIALENFDGIGLERTSSKREIKNKMVQIPIDSETTLPDGHKVDGLKDLKQYLLKNKYKEFAHALSHKMLTYALGRNLDLVDEESLPEITEAFVQSDYKLNALIEAIVLSNIFSSSL